MWEFDGYFRVSDFFYQSKSELLIFSVAQIQGASVYFYAVTLNEGLTTHKTLIVKIMNTQKIFTNTAQTFAPTQTAHVVLENKKVKDSATLYDLPEVIQQVEEVTYKVTLTDKYTDILWLYFFNEEGDLAEKVKIRIHKGTLTGKLVINPAANISRIGMITLNGNAVVNELVLTQAK